MRFSERHGLVEVRKALQGRNLDQQTRNRLWSAVALSIALPQRDVRRPLGKTWMRSVYEQVWTDLLKQPVDEMPIYDEDVRAILKTHCIQDPWFTTYDLLEYLIQCRDHSNRTDLISSVSQILSEEMAGFRLINGEFVEITDETEIAAIEEAIAATQSDRFAPARAHINTALRLLSDRHKPDHRNSIKESVSAVEAVAKIISGNAKASLGDALKIVDQRAPLHGALKSALLKLYGYTSDAHGIRHALSDASALDAADAKFMLVACSAFVVFVIQKSDGVSA